MSKKPTQNHSESEAEPAIPDSISAPKIDLKKVTKRVVDGMSRFTASGNAAVDAILDVGVALIEYRSWVGQANETHTTEECEDFALRYAGLCRSDYHDLVKLAGDLDGCYSAIIDHQRAADASGLPVHPMTWRVLFKNLYPRRSDTTSPRSPRQTKVEPEVQVTEPVAPDLSTPAMANKAFARIKELEAENKQFKRVDGEISKVHEDYFGEVKKNKELQAELEALKAEATNTPASPALAEEVEKLRAQVEYQRARAERAEAANAELAERLNKSNEKYKELADEYVDLKDKLKKCQPDAMLAEIEKLKVTIVHAGQVEKMLRAEIKAAKKTQKESDERLFAMCSSHNAEILSLTNQTRDQAQMDANMSPLERVERNHSKLRGLGKMIANVLRSTGPDHDISVTKANEALKAADISYSDLIVVTPDVLHPAKLLEEERKLRHRCDALEAECKVLLAKREALKKQSKAA